MEGLLPPFLPACRPSDSAAGNRRERQSGPATSPSIPSPELYEVFSQARALAHELTKLYRNCLRLGAEITTPGSKFLGGDSSLYLSNLQGARAAQRNEPSLHRAALGAAGECPCLENNSHLPRGHLEAPELNWVHFIAESPFSEVTSPANCRWLPVSHAGSRRYLALGLRSHSQPLIDRAAEAQRSCPRSQSC